MVLLLPFWWLTASLVEWKKLTFMQIKTDDGEKAYYNVEHVNETVFYEEVVTPDINHQFEYVDLGLPSGTLWATCNIFCHLLVIFM